MIYLSHTEKHIFTGGKSVKTKALTFWESLFLVAGAGIGTGILTIPYAVSQIGFFGTVFALAVAYAVSAALYLIIADLALRSQKSEDLLGILKEHLFYGKYKKLLSAVFFVILIVLLLENLVVYIMCASEVITDMLGVSPFLAKTAFYILASAVILFGIKGIGIGEKYSVSFIGIVIAVLTVLSFMNVKNPLVFSFGAPKTVFAVYGLFMFAFSAIFSVIQVCNHIDNRKNAGKAVIGGLTVNALFTLLFVIASVVGSESVTEVATTGLSESIGIPVVKVLCSVFVILAMFSSFWSSGLAFADVLSQQLSMGKKGAWFVATVPTVIIALFLPLTVLDYVQIGAGALSVILVIVVLPAYYHAIKNADGRLLLGAFAKRKTFLYVIAAFVLLMAVSSLIPVN